MYELLGRFSIVSSVILLSHKGMEYLEDSEQYLPFFAGVLVALAIVGLVVKSLQSDWTGTSSARTYEVRRSDIKLLD